jgi:hypothetical protein
MTPKRIKVMERQDDLKSVLWMKIGGQRYAFSYNHENRIIEMRQGTTQGSVFHSFSNATPTTEIEAVFRAL